MSHSESRPGILSAKNSMKTMKPLRRDAPPDARAAEGRPAAEPSPGSRPGRSAARPGTGAGRWPSRWRRPARAVAAGRASPSPARPNPRGLALLEEGLHAFAPFLAGADVGDAAARSSRSARRRSPGPPCRAPAACRPHRRPGCCARRAFTMLAPWHRAHRPPPPRARSRCDAPRPRSKRSAVRK